MPSIIFEHVDFSYHSPDVEIFRDLSLLIDAGWRTGVVGRNGRGKSTLLKLIRGAIVPQAGRVEVPVAVRHFIPDVRGTGSTFDVVRNSVAPYSRWEARMRSLLESVPPEISAYDRVHDDYQRAGGYRIEGWLQREFVAMGLDPNLLERPFDALSGGERTRALICGLFCGHRSGHFALIDEPTNHLDASGRQRLAAYLARQRGFLLVSHDRSLLDGAVDHLLAINRSGIEIMRGNYTLWREEFESRMATEAATRSAIGKDVRRLQAAAAAKRRNAESREREKYRSGAPDNAPDRAWDRGFIGHRAAKQMKRAIAVERRISTRLEEKRGLLADHEKRRELRVETLQRHRRPLLQLQNVTLARGDRVLTRELSFDVTAGDRIALTGRNGSGKSTLLAAIAAAVTANPAGADQEDPAFTLRSGVIRHAAPLDIGRGYQEPLWRNGQLREHLSREGLDETRFRELLAAFGLRGEVFERDLSGFSPGQRKIADLCRSLLRPVDLLLWDEPLNFIDVLAREDLETAILRDRPTLLFVEHDRAFIDRVATHVVSLDD